MKIKYKFCHSNSHPLFKKDGVIKSKIVVIIDLKSLDNFYKKDFIDTQLSYKMGSKITLKHSIR